MRLQWCTPILGMGVSTTTRLNNSMYVVGTKLNGILKKIGLLGIEVSIYIIFASLKGDFLALLTKKYTIR